jgi:hypothetical protein
LYTIIQKVRKSLSASVKKNTHSDQKVERGPKTEQDEKFLLLVAQIMKAQGIGSERAFSLELERGPDFISRIRRGIQSAPADAWDDLLKKYPESRNITTTNVMSQGGGQAIGNVEGDANYTIGDCEKERDAYKNEVEQLRQQVASQAALLEAKDVIIASKEETINLLRASYNRPN